MSGLVHFPARRREAPVNADLSDQARRDVELVQWWRGRSLEVLHRVGASVEHMATIRHIADDMIESIFEDDA